MTLRRSFVRWLAAVGTMSLLAGGLAQTSIAATEYTVYNSSSADPNKLEGSEILDITPDNKYAVIVGANNVGEADRKETKVRIATIDPTNPGIKLFSLELTAIGTSLGLQRPVSSSVAVHPTAGYAIVTLKECVESCPTPSPAPNTIGAGGAVFVSIGGNGSLSTVGTPLQLGVQPESIDIAPNGLYAVVANEGTGTNGSISVIDLRGGPTGANQLTYPLNTPNPQPEAVSISPDSTRAFVTLQGNNAVAVMDINPTNLAPELDVRDLGNDPIRNVKRNPDGIAVAPGGQYFVTANEGLNNTIRANSVSLFRVDPDRSIAHVQTSSITSAPDARPEMVAIGLIGGQLKAFVTLEETNAVAVFNVVTTGTPSLTLEKEIPLNPSSTGNAADSPEGIAVAHGLDLIVTANQISKNISVIKATNPAPNPNLTEKVYLPLVSKP